MTNEKKIRNRIIVVAVCLLALVAVLNFMSQMAKYNDMQARKELLQKKINDANNNIEELEYWIGAPVDDDYIIKFARENLDLYRSDEVVFFGDSNE